MGAEAFRVRLNTNRTAERVHEALRALPGMRPGTWDGSLVYEDERYIVDLDLTHASAGTNVSVGFALCQDPSIDGFFPSFVLRVADLLDAASTLVEGPSPAVFLRDRTGLAAWIVNAIEEPRRLWQLEFGAQTAKLGCSDAIRTYCELQLAVTQGPTR
jgi:hypothetical protein